MRLSARLCQLEEHFGALQTQVPRQQVSPYDYRSAAQLHSGGMIGGDRMKTHGYAQHYARYLAPLFTDEEQNAEPLVCHKPLTILECGILKGSGLALWSVLFPKATIIGLDIDLTHFKNNESFLRERGAFAKKEPRLFQFDQLDPRLPSELIKLLLKRGSTSGKDAGDTVHCGALDLYIDDGLHQDIPILNTLIALRSYLKDSCVCFIEDNAAVSTALKAFCPYFEVDSQDALTVLSPKKDAR